MRIDKLLCFLRFAKTRAIAQRWIGEGHMRLNGQRVDRVSAAVNAGDVLTLPLHGGVRVIEIVTLPARRGPAAEAQSCYRVLDGRANFAIAPAQEPLPGGKHHP